jgi:hypothetical protein
MRFLSAESLNYDETLCGGFNENSHNGEELLATPVSGPHSGTFIVELRKTNIFKN